MRIGPRRALLFGSRQPNIGVGLQTSLVSWWTLDEASDGSVPVARNDSHGANHLTDNNTTRSAAGKKSNGADFEIDETEWLNRADNAALNTGDIDFTFTAWVRFESAPANVQGRPIVVKYGLAGNQREYLLMWENDVGSGLDHLEFVVSNDGTAVTSVRATTLGTPSLATWYFVVAWHDATANTINIQVNNGAIDSAAHATGVFNGTADFEIGSLNGLAAFSMDGLIDEVGFWKRTLTTVEKTWLYNEGTGRSYSEVNPT